MLHWNEMMNAKTYEPEPRLAGGRFGYVRHRFPIKNGISIREVMLRSMYCTPQWSHLFERGADIGEIMAVKTP